MKNYEEVTRDLLKRRNEYEEAQTKRQRNALRIAVPVCSVALAAAIGVGVWRSGILAKPPIAGDSGALSAVQLVSPDDPHTTDKIVINKVKSITNVAQDIALFPEDYIEMTYEEKLEYLGAEIKPDVPEDLTLWEYEDNHYGIYRENGGAGEVYYDNEGFYYYNEDDDNRYVRIAASKGRLPFSCVVWADECKDKSYLQGVEILILKYNEYHCAEFMVRGVGFRIEANGLSDEEFVSVVASIIEKNK